MNDRIEIKEDNRGIIKKNKNRYYEFTHRWYPISKKEAIGKLKSGNFKLVKEVIDQFWIITSEISNWEDVVFNGAKELLVEETI